MLFTEAQLQMVGNPMAVLDEATYLNEGEALIRSQTIPVSENTRIGAYTVRFDDVDRLAESHGVDYLTAIVAIAESSGIDPNYLKVAVDEADIICDPEIVTALPEDSVIVAPLSEQSLACQYVTECIGLWDQMPDTNEADMALAEALIDDTYLEQFVNEANGTSNQNGPGIMDRIKGFGSSVAGAAKKFPGIGDISTSRTVLGNIRQIRADNAPDKNPNLSDDDRKQLEGTLKSQSRAAYKLGAKGVAKASAATAAIGAAAYGIGKYTGLIKQADNKPKSWIGQKIAALRKVYQSWMQKAEKGGPGAGAKIKQAAAKLLSIIDALMAKMQKAAG